MARSSGATPSLIPHSLAVKGPNPWVDVTAWGVVGNGTTDDSAAIQAMLVANPGAVTFWWPKTSGYYKAITKTYPAGNAAGADPATSAPIEVLQANNGATFRFAPGAVIKGPDTGAPFIINGDNVTIEGGEFTKIGSVTATYTNGAFACTLGAASDVVLNRYIEGGGAGLTVQGAYFHDLGGVAISAANDLTVTRCRFVRCGTVNHTGLIEPLGPPNGNNASGIIFSTALRGTVTLCRFTDCGGSPINIQGANGGWHLIAYNEMVGADSNTIATYMENGVYLNSGSFCKITHNVIRNANHEGAVLQGVHNEFSHNSIDQTGASVLSTSSAIGLTIGGAGPLTISHNKISVPRTSLAATVGSGANLTDLAFDHNDFIGGNVQLINGFTLARVSFKGDRFLSGAVFKNAMSAALSLTMDEVEFSGTNAAGEHIMELGAAKYTLNDLVFSDVAAALCCIWGPDPTDAAVASTGSITNPRFRNVVVSGTHAALMRVGAARVSGARLREITAPGIFGRWLTGENDVVIRDMVIEDAITNIKALVYGTDTAMGVGAGDGWFVENSDLLALPLTTSASGSVTPLAVNIPVRSGRTTYAQQFTISKDVPVQGGTGIFDIVTARRANGTEPVSVAVLIMCHLAGGAAGAYADIAWLYMHKNAAGTLIKTLTQIQTSAGGPILQAAAADFSDVGGAAAFLTVRYTNADAVNPNNMTCHVFVSAGM